MVIWSSQETSTYVDDHFAAAIRRVEADNVPAASIMITFYSFGTLAADRQGFADQVALSPAVVNISTTTIVNQGTAWYRNSRQVRPLRNFLRISTMITASVVPRHWSGFIIDVEIVVTFPCDRKCRGNHRYLADETGFCGCW